MMFGSLFPSVGVHIGEWTKQHPGGDIAQVSSNHDDRFHLGVGSYANQLSNRTEDWKHGLQGSGKCMLDSGPRAFTKLESFGFDLT